MKKNGIFEVSREQIQKGWYDDSSKYLVKFMNVIDEEYSEINKDFEKVVNSVNNTQKYIKHVHNRIKQLMAGLR